MINKLQQPKSLYILSIVNLWQRFGFYTLQAVLVLYLVKAFHLTNANAYGIFSVTSALLYLMPIFGGYAGDKILSAKTCVLIGSIASAMGYGMLAFPDRFFLYAGLATLIVGTGLFMPNIATLLSGIYKKEDMRREAGFSIFYTFINIGGFFPPIICAFVIYRFGWGSVFYLSAIAMILSLLTLLKFNHRHSHEKQTAPDPYYPLKVFGVLAIMFVMTLCFILLVLYPQFTDETIFVFSAFFVACILKKTCQFKQHERCRLLACLILIMFSVFFEVLYGQAGMSLTIFTEFNTARDIGNFTIPTVAFRSLNPFFIIVLGPLFGQLWLSLSHSHKNPSVPVKFGIGTLLMGFGFVLLPFAIQFCNVGRLDFGWIILSYFFQTVGELLISPIGLSMIADLSPRKMLGLMMGTWYFATAFANAIAGKVSELTTLPSGTNDPEITATVYSHIFGVIGVTGLAAGVLILIAAPRLNKMIQA